MTNNINWGILGTGRIARSFAEALSHVDDAKLLAVGSRNKNTATEFADEFNIENAYSSYGEVCANKDVDVVYIATPHSLHKDNVIMCLEANKAVLCEKPFTINASEAETIIKLARSKNLFLMEAMWTRYLPALNKLRELLEEDTIGDVQIMLAGGAFMPEFDPDFYLFNKELGGGVLLDAGVYLISMASMLFGKPKTIKAVAGMSKSGVDEHDGYLLEHDSGALASMYVSLRGQSSPDVTLIGSKGKIYLHPPIFCPSKITLNLYDGDETVIDLPFEANGYQFQAMEVNRCIREGLNESELMPLDESLEIMNTMDKIRKQIKLEYPME
ncbi:MAG: Gfo/Idh/MocA family oxidoreductase [Gammaproteobacteria bacterium]|jgi:predicted dehydrogenase|nr:Gfo/Idh/MocA family oxidoreductase [Gammaproteobacteria bacterium]